MTIIASMPEVKIRCLNIHIHTYNGLGFLLFKADWSARAIIIIYLNIGYHMTDFETNTNQLQTKSVCKKFMEGQLSSYT